MSSAIDSIEKFYFKSPFTCVVAGPTQSGKTTLIKKILDENASIIKPEVHSIIYCYARWQDKYDELKKSLPNIEFHQGLYDIEQIAGLYPTVIIYDDLIKLCEEDESLLNLFTTDSHHKNISVLLLTQNLFCKGKNFRTISLNSNYMILMNNPRDYLQINCLARQMYPKNSCFLVEAYQDACYNNGEGYGYLMLDLTQKTSNFNRVQTGIFLNDLRIIYRPKK